MKVGEFFVEMNVKGAEKLKESFSDVGKSLKDVSEGALEGQSLLDKLGKMSVGLGATLEELSRRGSKVGLTLANFHRYTQLDVKPAQEFARAMNQVGISTNQSLDAISNIQDQMAKIRMGKGAVGSFFGTLGINTQNISSPYQVLELLHHFVRSNPEKFTPDIVNQIVGETGISKDMIAAFRAEKNIFPHLGAGQYLTGEQIGKDASIAGKWEMLGTDLENLAGKLASLFGPTLVSTLDKFTLALNRFIDTTQRVVDKSAPAATALGQAGAVVGVGAAGGGLGLALGAAGFTGLAGPLALLGAIPLGAYFIGKDLGVGKLLSNLGQDFNAGSQIQLNLTNHVTVPAAGDTKRVHTSRQATTLHAGKTTQAQHSSLQSPSRNGGNF